MTGVLSYPKLSGGYQIRWYLRFNTSKKFNGTEVKNVLQNSNIGAVLFYLLY